MNKITLALGSRTVWTIVAMFLIGGINAVQTLIPASILPVVQGALGLLAVYFKVNPSQSYN